MEIKYDNHSEEWEKCLNNEERKKIAASWIKSGTLDKFRHDKMLEGIDALIEGENSWLTLGDGRYGTDAHYIIAKGGNAHASDISNKLLEIGNKIGFIESFSAENAENLSFDDESFDYVLIKEAFHHFPRPWIALYEAFRVCKKGVILIEPNDLLSKGNSLRQKIFEFFKLLVKIILKKEIYRDGYNFETVGNFIFDINQRELEKFLLGMHYRYIACKYLNDFYLKGGENISLKSKDIKDRIKILMFRTILFSKELITKLGFQEKSILSAILFKEKPSEKTIIKLKKRKWKIKELPKNPFI